MSKKYTITKPRYVRQAGCGLPGYVDASVEFPAVIELDDGHPEDEELTPVPEASSAPPPAFPAKFGGTPKEK